ncbi:MAG: hypothetical protein LBB89_00040 [Treponema sp.]|jgi:hypothetical protein|nr:hypothetical protein [Treponema sp.]
MVILWYGLVPVAGALVKRYKWYIFRKRFDKLRLSPILDYRQYSQEGKDIRLSPKADTFRFIGGFESVTDGQTLWIRGEDLTVPVSLQNAEIYLLPMQKGESISEVFDPGEETPEKIRWERVSALTEGARVFAGGLLVCRNGRRSFASAKNKPLMMIFFDGPDHSLATRAIRAGRNRGEYWNTITPFSLVVGALFQILVAVTFLSRPAYRLTVIVSIIALFIPLYPMIPPGLLFTVVYRRLAWRSRILRAYRDLARLPLRYLPPRKNKGLSGSFTPLESCLLPNGEQYGFICVKELPSQAEEGKIPLLLPELTKAKKDNLWYIFGALRPGGELPVQPEDYFATFGILPGRPEAIARYCEILAYTLELAAWLVLLTGIGLNIFFLRMVLVLL